MAVLTDDGGGVPPLAVVVTSASNAGQLADSGREDHLDPSRVVAHCSKKQGKIREEADKEKRGHFCVHR